MIKEKRIKVPIYNTFIFVGFYDDSEELNKKYGTDSTHTTDAICWGSIGGTAVFFNKNKISQRVIAHECVHIVNYIFKEKGIKLDLNNDEPQAYLMDWVFNEVNKTLTNL